MIAIQDGPWRLGLNSVDDPCELPLGQYQWAANAVNKGGVLSTRPGFSRIASCSGVAKGIKIFTPSGGNPVMVAASGTSIEYRPYPFTGSWITIPGLSFNGDRVEMEVAVIGVTQDDDGNITATNPTPVLMICDGQSRTAYWDGTYARHLDPVESETPVCSWMKWIGNRLWTMQGRKIRVSDLLNPILFTEEDILSEGGYFNLPGDGTGFGVTPDSKSLLAFTDYTTTAFQAGILNRATWSSTQDFQKVIFYNIGCAAGRSIVNQYGMTWWFSHNGLISLDSALQTYRSSEIKYKDSAMRRSRSNLAPDISGICSAAFENYLLISVPAGDLHNYHTWVMDQNPSEISDSPAIWSSAWTGVRPVQWATEVISGEVRCFAAAVDLPLNFSIGDPNIWEAVIAHRRDIGYNSSGVVTPRDIPSFVETRAIPFGKLCRIKYIEIDVEEAIGTIQIDIFYATRRGTYKRFGSKQVVATVGSVSPSVVIPAEFDPYLPQKRTLKSENETTLSADINPNVETGQIKSIDKYFSFVIQWEGQMAISKIRVYADEEPEQMDGASEDDEETDRFVSVGGDGEILSTGPSSIPIPSNLKSGFLPSMTPRWSPEIHRASTVT